MHCIFWKILVVSTENKFLFEDSFNVLFVRIIFLWFFMIFIMAYLWKGFSCGFYDFLHAIFVVMVFVVFCFNPLWFLWFLWFLWSLTFYSFFTCSVCPVSSVERGVNRKDAFFAEALRERKLARGDADMSMEASTGHLGKESVTRMFVGLKAVRT